MSKNLKYFMREAAEVERVVTVPAPESFKDENGKVIQLEVKVLSSERIRAINEAYHTHTVALDKKGNPYINGGNVVFRDERDNAKATRHILVEALQYPKLDDPELIFLSTPSARRATAKTETKSLFLNKLYNILHEFRRALIYNGSKNYPNHAK